MSLSSSTLAYTDCFRVFEQALADPNGVRVLLPNMNAATFLRMRLHKARQLDRDNNLKVYTENRDHPLYGKSQFDGLVIKIRQEGEGTYLYLEPVDTLEYEVEGLSELRGLPAPPRFATLPSPAMENIEIAEGEAITGEIEILPPAEPIRRRSVS